MDSDIEAVLERGNEFGCATKDSDSFGLPVHSEGNLGVKPLAGFESLVLGHEALSVKDIEVQDVVEISIEIRDGLPRSVGGCWHRWRYKIVACQLRAYASL